MKPLSIGIAFMMNLDKIIYETKRLFEDNSIKFDSNWQNKILEKIN